MTAAFAVSQELGYRAASGQSMMPLTRKSPFNKIIFLHHNCVSVPQFGESICLHTLHSQQSHEALLSGPQRAAGRLYAVEIQVRLPNKDFEQVAGKKGVDEESKTIRRTQISNLLILMADVLAPNVTDQLNRNDCEQLWIGRGQRTPLDHVQTGKIELGNSKKPFLFLAACVVIRNSRGECLITRRASHMRTFPNCWVFPGGGNDENESLINTALREAYEETGLKLEAKQLRRLCLWESAFPTTLQACTESAGLKRHQLVVFFVCQLTEAQTQDIDECGLSIDPGEVDEAVWLSKAHVKLVAQAIIGDLETQTADNTNTNDKNDKNNILLPSCVRHLQREQQLKDNKLCRSSQVNLKLITAVYPHRETHQGCAEGHIFALSVLAHNETEFVL